MYSRCLSWRSRRSPGCWFSLVRGRFPCTSSPVVLLHSCSRRFRSPPCVRSLFSPLFRGGWILGARCAPGDSRSRAAASRGTLRRAFSPRGRSMCFPLSRGGWIASAVVSRGTPRRSPVALCLVLLYCFRALDVLPVRCWFFLVRALPALSLYPRAAFGALLLPGALLVLSRGGWIAGAAAFTSCGWWRALALSLVLLDYSRRFLSPCGGWIAGVWRVPARFPLLWYSPGALLVPSRALSPALLPL